MVWTRILWNGIGASSPIFRSETGRPARSSSFSDLMQPRNIQAVHRSWCGWYGPAFCGTALERAPQSSDLKPAVLLAAAVFLISCSRGTYKRFIVLGVDGMDPHFVERHWSELPNLPI